MQSDGAVVASHHLVADLAVAQAWQQTARQHKVIEPPAHVLLAGVHHVGPEGVGVGLLGVELAEAVDETGFQQLAETLALFGGEACVLLVPLGVLQVDLPVCNIKVATQHHRLLYVQLAQVHPEVYVPGFAVIQAHKASARVWHICGHQEEVGELGSDDAALLVMLFFAWRVGRGGSGKNSFISTGFIAMFSLISSCVCLILFTMEMKGNKDCQQGQVTLQLNILLNNVKQYVADSLSLKQ